MPAVIGDSVGEHGIKQSRNERWRKLAYCSSFEARNRVPYDHAKRLRCLPLGICEQGDGRLLLTVAAPADAPQAVFQELRFIADAELLVEPVELAVLIPAIAAAYEGQSDALIRLAGEANRDVVPRIAGSGFHPPASAHAEESRPVPLLLEAMLSRAHYLSASDIHLEPNLSGARLRFRVDGRLREDSSFSVSPSVAENVVRRVKVLAGLDTTVRSRPQEGAFTYLLSNQVLRLRVSVIPQLGGEKLVLRVFDNPIQVHRSAGEQSAFTALGLSREHDRLLRAHLGAERGTILLTGPTGSGKTTLLYAALEHLNAEWRNIVTLEDPIERAVAGINQTEVNREAGNTFAGMLPALLRQDPDVIMLGEIRDTSTAETAFTAAITGHLVLSTVHAGDCFEAFTRLDQLGLDSRLMLTALRLVISQRLLPLNCRACMERRPAGEKLAAVFGIDESSLLAAAAGCNTCGGTGLAGRIGIYEMLPLSQAITAVLEQRGQLNPIEWSAKLRDAAYQNGFVPLALSIRSALLAGHVSPVVALRGLGIAPDLFGF